MVTIRTEVVRKMLNFKYKKLFYIFVLCSLFVPRSIFAINYGSGPYGGSLYSATIPGVTANPAGGIYNKTQQITLLTEAGNTIRYLFTSTPSDCLNGNLYTGPIDVATDTTIYTLTCDSYGNSTNNSFHYVIKLKQKSSGYFNKNNLMSTDLVNKVQDLTKEDNIKNEVKGVLVAPLTKNLKMGTNNREVKILQIFLNKKGYVISPSGGGSPGNETNYFGSKTRQALKLFQRDNKLIPDGIIGPFSIKLINSLR